MENTLLEEVIATMIRNDRIHRALIDERIHPIGSNRTAHMMLMHLARKERCPSQRELANHLRITPAAVTGILKRLEGEGLICREDGRDNRYHEISLTDAGREVVLRSREIFADVDRSLFEGFSEGELTTYLSLMQKIQANMQAMKYNKDNKEGDTNP